MQLPFTSPPGLRLADLVDLIRFRLPLDLPGFGSPAAADNPLTHVVPHPLWQVPADLGFLTPEGVVTVLSDQIVMILLGALVVMIGLPWLLRRRASAGSGDIEHLVPTRRASFVELICEYFRKEVAEPHLGHHARRYLPFIWTAFFFVLVLNLLGLIPFATLSPPLTGLHIGGTATGNIWVTATLAVMTLVLMVFGGLRYAGKDYLAHFSPGPIWMAPLMIPVEVMGLFAKIFALAVRLFANMVAGHILLAVLVAMILRAGTALGPIGGFGVAIVTVAGSVAITLLEIFVAFLQAFIFTYLSTLFIGMSVNIHHEETMQEADLTEDLAHLA